MADYKIPKKERVLRGEDNYSSFTVRIPKELENKLSDIAYQTMRSRNEVVWLLLEEAVKHVSY